MASSSQPPRAGHNAPSVGQAQPDRPSIPPAEISAPSERISKLGLRRYPYYVANLEGHYELFVGSLVERYHLFESRQVSLGGCVLATGTRAERSSVRAFVHLKLPSGERVRILGSITSAQAPRFGPDAAVLAPGMIAVRFATEDLPEAYVTFIVECEHSGAQVVPTRASTPPPPSRTSVVPPARTSTPPPTRHPSSVSAATRAGEVPRGPTSVERTSHPPPPRASTPPALAVEVPTEEPIIELMPDQPADRGVPPRASTPPHAIVEAVPIDDLLSEFLRDIKTHPAQLPGEPVLQAALLALDSRAPDAHEPIDNLLREFLRDLSTRSQEAVDPATVDSLLGALQKGRK